jgi:hypothetical protein
MSGYKKRKRAASATPWDNLPKDELSPAQALITASHMSMYAFRHESFAGDIEFLNSYLRSTCPECGSRAIKFGLGKNGIQRYRCCECFQRFTSTTGTVFEDRKLPLSAWADFLLQVFSYASISLMTREDRRSDTTLPYWMAKLFAVLEGIQDDTMLSGKVWVDETYWPVAGKDAVRNANGKLPRGLSKNQICIGVGVDDSGRSIFFREGLGKTSGAKTMQAFGDRIVPRSTLIHDLEPAHNKIVSKLELADERHDAGLLKGVADALNPLQPVNRVCFLLKSFLRSHPGFDRSDLQGYLDLFHVMMNKPEDKMEKAALVLDRAMRYPKTIRFREHYNVNSRSGS